MKKSIIGLIAIFTILLSACSKDTLRGDGAIITEDRTLLVQNGLETIRINGSTDVKVIYGTDYHLEVKGYANLVAALSTDVKNNTLVVEYPNHHNVRNENTQIMLTIPYLPNLYLNGNIDAQLSGIFPAKQSINFTINGSGIIHAADVNMNADFAKYQINGSGNINTYNLISKTCEASISGSGKITTSVFNLLKANISGSGEIYYNGNPTVDSDISGSGKVSKL